MTTRDVLFDFSDTRLGLKEDDHADGFLGAGWVRNARVAGEAARRRGRQTEGVPTGLPTGVSFMKNAGLVKDGRPEEFEAPASRCAVLRFGPMP